MKKLLVFGSSNIDHIVQMPVFPKAGETLHGTAYQQAYGGKGANQAVAAVKLGADVRFVSALGNDAEGDALLAHFAALGMDVSSICRVDGNTGMAMIWLNAAGENSIVVIAGANGALDADRVERRAEEIAGADTLLMQLETPLAGVMRAAEIAKAHGVRTILNPAPAQALPPALLRHIDMITPNESEAEILTGIAVDKPEDAARAAAVLHKQGIHTVVITLGAKGVYASEDGKGAFHRAFAVKAVDTTAAGDTFNGGFVAALLRGQSLSQAIRYGQAAAALAVQHIGAQPSIPDAQAVAAFLAMQS